MGAAGGRAATVSVSQPANSATDGGVGVETCNW